MMDQVSLRQTHLINIPFTYIVVYLIIGLIYSVSGLAISPNSNEVHIYRREGLKWTLESILNQHDLRVSSIDWAPKSNRIVTCSAVS